MQKPFRDKRSLRNRDFFAVRSHVLVLELLAELLLQPIRSERDSQASRGLQLQARELESALGRVSGDASIQQSRTSEEFAMGRDHAVASAHAQE